MDLIILILLGIALGLISDHVIFACEGGGPSLLDDLCNKMSWPLLPPRK